MAKTKVKRKQRAAHEGLSPETLKELKQQFALGLKRPYHIALVTWDDACLVSDHWSQSEMVLEDAKGHALITSVGLLLADNKDYIVICISCHDGVVDCALKIPRSNIRSFKRLATVIA